VVEVAAVAVIAIIKFRLMGGKSLSSKVRSTCCTFRAHGGLANCLGLSVVMVTVVVCCWRVIAYAMDAAIRMGLSSHLGIICKGCDITLVCNVLGVKCGEHFISPFVCMFKVLFVVDQENFVLGFGAFYAVTPWLITNQVMESKLINIIVTVKGEGKIEHSVLHVAKIVITFCKKELLSQINLA